MPSLMDEIMKDAMRKGDFANLPGQGKPLKLEEDPHTPEHMRMAYKILKENDLAPEWIMQGKELDAARAKWLKDVQRRAASFDVLRERGKAINKQILSFNLKVPPGVVHKLMLDIEAELLK